jgi:hypothetical protein
VVNTYRFMFSFDPHDGTLRWAHGNPKGDVAAAEHLGKSIAYVGTDGEIVVLDAANGARLWAGRAGMPVMGATFDADGFVPAAGTASPPDSLAATLRRIVWDPDRRFIAVKVFAVDALARLPGTDVSRELLKVITREGIPRELYARAGDVLVNRKDATIVPDLVGALKIRYDYVEGSKPRGLEIIARALAAIGTSDGMSMLLDHLLDPETSLIAVREIAVAASRAKIRAAVPAFRDFLTTYRADPVFQTDPGPMIAVVEGLLQIGASKERQLLRFVADDPRTLEKLRAYIAAALEQTRQGQIRTPVTAQKGPRAVAPPAGAAPAAPAPVVPAAPPAPASPAKP